MVLAPVEFSRRDDTAKSLLELTRQGFARVMVDGQMHELGGEIADAVKFATRLDVVIDRLILREGIEKRLADSLELAARAGQQIIKISVLGSDESAAPRQLVFSLKFICAQCGSAAPEVTPSLFSFNSPQGACPKCNGLGAGKQAGEIERKMPRRAQSAAVNG